MLAPPARHRPPLGTTNARGPRGSVHRPRSHGVNGVWPEWLGSHQKHEVERFHRRKVCKAGDTPGGFESRTCWTKAEHEKKKKVAAMRCLGLHPLKIRFCALLRSSLAGRLTQLQTWRSTRPPASLVAFSL